MVVPGHGEMCGLKEVAVFRGFIETCIERTRSAIREGKSKEQTVETLSFEALYPSDRCQQAVHPGAGMQRRNVSRLYDKLSEQGDRIT